MFLFKTYTLEFEFDRHLKRMVSYQGMLLVGEFGAFEIFMKNVCSAKPDSSYFPNKKHKNRSHLDRI